ncbi:hypothetical protein DASC09_063050 [Saccharomycopsis crataegensis]|uniref:Protein kinase domain-containing protein n=1 Tax=Saccharomycopsis crataegensis TaxID=43959 RepID=A0AAV5QW70_9ASCO|nr:hypothetical protein DASC09_063050 [Saccharomycopsis crataegensis]
MSAFSTLLALLYEEFNKSEFEIAQRKARLNGDASALLSKDHFDSIFCEAASDDFRSYATGYFEVMAKSGIQRRFDEKIDDAKQTLGYHTVYIDHEDLVDEGISRSIQTDFFQNSQVFRVKIKELKDAGVSIEEDNKKHVLLKIFDPQKYMINMESRTEPEEVIQKMVSHFRNEYISYKSIDLHNQKNQHEQISKLKIYAFAFFRVYFKQNNKLEDPHRLENYIAVGPVFLAEELTTKPKTIEDFVEGAKQLLHMHNSGVYHNDIKLSNVFMRKTKHKNNFVFIDYGLSEIKCVPKEKKSPKSSGGIDWCDFETLAESMGIEKAEWERALFSNV